MQRLLNRTGQAPGLCQAPQGAWVIVPRHVLGALNRVVAVEARDGDKLILVGLEASVLPEVADLSLDLVVPLLSS